MKKKTCHEIFEKKVIWSYLIKLRGKLVNRALFKATDYQKDSKIWFPKFLEKKKYNFFYRTFPFCIRKSEKPIFTVDSVLYSEGFSPLLMVKREILRNILYGESYFWQSVALLYRSCPKVWLSFISSSHSFSKISWQFFSNSGFKLST